MKTSHYSRSRTRTWPMALIAALLCFEAAIAVTSAQDTAPGQPAKSGEPPTASANAPDERIHIVADRLVTDNESNWAEFIGNVKATQGTTVITSNRLKIFYRRISENRENIIGGEDSVEKIVAHGNVVIHFENRLAESEQAVYITETKILILTGPNARISEGGNLVEGEKITLYRDKGQITVEGGDKKRVEAVIYSGENGLQ